MSKLNKTFNTPELITQEELAKFPSEEIGTGICMDDNAEVEAQSITRACPNCKNKYWNAVEFKITICPHCGHAVRWW